MNSLPYPWAVVLGCVEHVHLTCDVGDTFLEFLCLAALPSPHNLKSTTSFFAPHPGIPTGIPTKGAHEAQHVLLYDVRSARLTA